MRLTDSVMTVKGIGSSLALKYQKIGITTVGELLTLYPRGYMDFTHPYPVADAPYDTACVVVATVWGIGELRRLPGPGKRTMVKVSAGDDTAGLVITFFNNPYAVQKLHVGQSYYFFGKFAGKMTQREIVAPVIRPVQGGTDSGHFVQQQNGELQSIEGVAEAASTPGLVAVYPQTAGLSSQSIARAVRWVLQNLPKQAFEDPLPEELIQKYRLGSQEQAIRTVHAPANQQSLAAARRRLAFQELFILQLGMARMRHRSRIQIAPRIFTGQEVIQEFYGSLPYSPTDAQRRCIKEILQDLNGPTPMNRLLQGDVGSGKTMVAAAAIVQAAKAGWQSALMAPTEILARQHAQNLQKMLSSFGVQVVLLTGTLKAAERRQTLQQIADGTAGLVVGTHAVIGENVQFDRLGLVIADEQHRFGVRQRTALASKGNHPHILVMSATPIPRTLGLLLYGELDISILDELPPGRTPVKTYTVTTALRSRMFGFITRQLAAGRQAYLVCPAIEETESELQSVNEYLEKVAVPLLPGYRVGLVHGKMKSEQKAAVMTDFAAHRLDVLCSTTVIEVGVDVPNANIMVIENAERYGLSTLHQLRGRVGRGGGEAWCILVSDHEGEETRQRLEKLCSTTDGFAIARFDLETRGPGDFFGSRQHGLPQLHCADLVRDARMLEVAHAEADALLAGDEELQDHPILSAAVDALFRDGERN